MERQKTIRISVVGDSGSGKSTLLQKLIQSHSENEEITVDKEAFKGMVKLRDGQSCNLNILDTEDNDNLEEACADINNDVLLLTYCINQDASYNNLFLRCSAIKEQRENGKLWSKILVVGTKADCENSRQVPEGSGEKLMKTFGLDGSIECSSFSGYNINELFEETIRLALEKHNEDEERGLTNANGTLEKSGDEGEGGTKNHDASQAAVYVDNGQVCTCCAIM
ncbi:DEBR0S1_29712g1_1 [Brettanomyces bruxellensis]|uniref:DEBR0S1_29712g1_1 n=1 Tax=Dekkera bruxellensis TaxID=5007 RepID=A0A7D9H2P7_DEKBR|nr:DEBR0S1_29712g1_1 [Brettanomyces bruxellensis]